MEHVEVARAETERGEVLLRRRTTDRGPAVLELRVNGVFVMDNQETSTEIELAAAALALVEDPRDVLVGGLGLGFTVQRLLGDPRVERVVVVELEEALVGWMRDGTVPHGPALLADRRVRVVTADVRSAVAEATGDAAADGTTGGSGAGRYDLVLLDVDNGPGYLVHDANAAVYARAFLTDVRRLLAPGGVVVVWSADTAPELLDTMTEVFGRCEERAFDVALQGRQEAYYLYVARPDAA
ncbi:hypothetical protein SAMN04488570_2012 [Nocardioides scoriae]|uniref:Spermine/spermidine synthase n=1 Tax=Nocardioides scoriae TaxID=642780 RepID=A0A1H1SPA4_9ACTN|nr:hypothetical protein [Nocardioides scoriae]SDS49837.1 hypothetical protein SAMN04488570_2012 [Nocardioides scoriae]